MARETIISPQNFVLFRDTGVVPTIPDPATLRKYHADFIETDIEVGEWARNIVDGKLFFRNQTAIEEFLDDIYDDRYVKIGSGGAPIDLNDWFELMNVGEADEYLRCKKPFSGDYEIQAWTEEGQFPGTIWDAMPVASVAAVGGFQLDNDATHFYNGTGSWVPITSGTFDHAGLQHLAYADAGHTGFSPTVHNFVDTTNHPASGLTAGHFLRALSTTTYGFEAVAVAYVSGTPENNQIAVWTNANTIEGTSGITYDGTTFAITGNITATGEISAFTGDAPASWWESMPLAEIGIRGGIDLPNDADLYINGVGNWVEITPIGGSGMIWPSSGGFTVYSGSSTWSTSIPANQVAYFSSAITGTPSSSTWLRGDGAWTANVSSQWITSTNDIYYDTGNVEARKDFLVGNTTDGSVTTLTGRNTVSYSYTLNTKVGNYLRLLSNKVGATGVYVDEDGDTWIGYDPSSYAYTGKLIVYGNSQLLPDITHKIFGNNDSSNYFIGQYDATGSNGLDLHWYGGIKMNVRDGLGIHVASNTNVGINKSPSYKLDVNGTVAGTGGLFTGDVTIGTYHAETKLVLGGDSNQYIAYKSSADGVDMVGYQRAYLGASFYSTYLYVGNGAVYTNTNLNCTGGVTASYFKTADFKLEQSGSQLLIKYGTTIIGSISSAGYLKMKDESEAFVSSP